MIENNKEFIRKAQFPLTMACAVNPLPLLVYVSLTPGLLPFAWVLPLVYVLLAFLAFRLPGKHRLLYGIAGSVLLMGVGVLLLKADPNPFSLVVPVAYCAVLMASLPVASWGPEKELPAFWLYCGILLHAGTFVFKFFAKASHGLDWDAIDPGLLVSFFAMVILVMLSLTRLNLNNSANGRQKPSAFMWQKNITLTVIFFAVAALIAMVPGIYKVLDAAFTWLGTTIRNLIDSIEIEDVINDMGSGGSGPEVPTANAPDYSFVDQIITFVLNALFWLVAAFCMYVAVKILLPPIIAGIRKLFNKVLRNVSSYVNDVSGDYEDEVTDLRGAVSRQKRVRFSSSEERSLPPNERIRYRYRRIMSRHPEWESGSTARENLPNQAAPLYEKARYSDHPITEEDAAHFTSNTKRV